MSPLASTDCLYGGVSVLPCPTALTADQGSALQVQDIQPKYPKQKKPSPLVAIPQVNKIALCCCLFPETLCLVLSSVPNIISVCPSYPWSSFSTVMFMTFQPPALATYRTNTCCSSLLGAWPSISSFGSLGKRRELSPTAPTGLYHAGVSIPWPCQFSKDVCCTKVQFLSQHSQFDFTFNNSSFFTL